MLTFSLFINLLGLSFAQGSAGTEVDLETLSVSEFKKLCNPVPDDVTNLEAYPTARAILDAWDRDIPGFGYACLTNIFEIPWAKTTSKRCRIKEGSETGLVQSVEKYGNFVLITPLFNAQTLEQQVQSLVHEAARHCQETFPVYKYNEFNANFNPSSFTELSKEEIELERKRRQQGELARVRNGKKRILDSLSVQLHLGYQSSPSEKEKALKKIFNALPGEPSTILDVDPRNFVGRTNFAYNMEMRKIPDLLDICDLLDEDEEDDALDAMARFREATDGGEYSWSVHRWAGKATNTGQIGVVISGFYVNAGLATQTDESCRACSGVDEYEAFFGGNAKRIKDFKQACTDLKVYPLAVDWIRGRLAPSLVQTRKATAPSASSTTQAQRKKNGRRGILLPGSNSTRRMGGR